VKAAREKWHKATICEHLVFLRGVEVVFFEFREILLDIASNKLRDHLDPKRHGKIKVILTKFLDENILKRLGALIRFNNARDITMVGGVQAARAWPESEKDKILLLKMEERHRA